MKTGNRKASSLSIACAGTMLVAAMLACNTPIPKPASEVVCYEGITPGQTTKGQVIALLGDPMSIGQEDINEILLYPSSFPRMFNTIILQNQVVVFMDVLVDAENALAYSAIKALYGEPGQITYTTYLQGSMTYIYPDKGRAFIADENADVVFTKQCFLPISLEDYMNTWGKNLPSEDPFIQ